MTEVDAVLAEYPPEYRPTDITPPAVSSIEPLGSAGGMSGAQFGGSLLSVGLLTPHKPAALPYAAGRLSTRRRNG